MQSHYLKTHLSRNFGKSSNEWVRNTSLSFCIFRFLFPSLLCVNSAHCWGGLVPSEYFFIIMSLSPRLKNFLRLKSNLGQRLCHKKEKKKKFQTSGVFFSDEIRLLFLRLFQSYIFTASNIFQLWNSLAGHCFNNFGY